MTTDNQTVILTGLNRDKQSVTFRKEKAFIESIKAYVELLKFGGGLAEMGLLDARATAPAFEQNPADTISNIKRRFTAITNSAVQKHPAFSNPKLNYLKYQRGSTSRTSPFDAARYKLMVYCEAYSPLVFKEETKIVRLDAADREIFFTDAVIGYYTAMVGRIITANDKAIVERLTAILRNNYEPIFVIVPNITGYSLEDVSPASKPMRDVDAFFQAFGVNWANINWWNVSRLGEEIEESTLYKNSIHGHTICSRPMSDSMFELHIARKYLKGMLSKKDLDFGASRIGTYGNFHRSPEITMGYTERSFWDNVFAGFNYSRYNRHNPSSLADIRDTPYGNGNLIVQLTYMTNSYFKTLLGANMILARKQTDTDGKKYIDLNRFDHLFYAEPTLPAEVVSNPKRFVEFHTKLNDYLQELTNVSSS